MLWSDYGDKIYKQTVPWTSDAVDCCPTAMAGWVLQCYYICTSLYLSDLGFFWRGFSSVSDLGAGLGLKCRPIQSYTILFCFQKHIFCCWFVFTGSNAELRRGSEWVCRNSLLRFTFHGIGIFLGLIKYKLIKLCSIHICKCRELQK